MIGKQVKTLSALMQAARDRRAVICPGHGEYRVRKPAAWMINLSGCVLNYLFGHGMYFYEPEHPRKKHRLPSELMDLLPCISLWQPWASLVAAKLKTVETRAYMAPKTIIGKRIGIHAAQSFKGDRIACEDHEELWKIRLDMLPKDLPRGAIVATAMLKRSAPSSEFKADIFGDYEPGRFGWELTDIVALETTISCKGKQGLFYVTVPEEILYPVIS